MKLSEAEGIYKGYRIVNWGGYNLLEIKSVGQGPVPEPLRGNYTSHANARKAIDNLVDIKENPGGKTTGRGKG